jgi:hypothetical protein
MAEKWLIDVLKSRGFSNDVAKSIADAAEENAKRDSEQKELEDRQKALGIALKFTNEMLPALKQAMDAEEKRRQKPTKTIIIDDK